MGITIDPPGIEPAPVPGTAAPTARSSWSSARRRLRADRGAVLSIVFLVVLVMFALGAPLIALLTGHEVNQQDTARGLDDNSVPVFPFTNGYVLGADGLGRDLLVRLAYGARTSLFIGVVATALTVGLALVLGTLAGYFGGVVDTIVSRVIDVVAAFPFLLFAIAMSITIGASVAIVIAIIVLFSWFYPARIFRGEVLALRDREFVESARMLGASTPRILIRHLLPHLLPSLTVYATLSVAGSIGFEASLSYLGFGLPPDQPSWGHMIADATRGGLYTNDPWLMLFPGTLLFLTILAFNVLGDGLRDAFDPRGGPRPVRRRTLRKEKR